MEIRVLHRAPNNLSVCITGITAAGRIQLSVTNSDSSHEQGVEDGTMLPRASKLDRVIRGKLIKSGAICLGVLERGNTYGAINQSSRRCLGDRQGNLCFDLVPGRVRCFQGQLVGGWPCQEMIVSVVDPGDYYATSEVNPDCTR